MSSSPVSHYADSETLAITTANAVYNRPVNNSQRDENPIVVRVISDVGFHVAWNRPAVATDAYVPGECIEYYAVGPNETLNFIRQSIDGNMWITVVELS